MTTNVRRKAAGAAATPATIATTLGALVNAEPALGRLLALSLPVKVAYHVAKLARFVAAETAHFNEQRAAAIRELGADRDPTPPERQAGHTSVREVTPDNMPAFIARIQELGSIEVSIAWAPLDLNALGEIAITGDDLLALDPLLAADLTSAGTR